MYCCYWCPPASLGPELCGAECCSNEADMDGSSVRLRGNRSVCREGIKPICLTIHKVLALTSGSTQHIQYVELCCIYWIFIHVPVRWVMRTTDIFDDLMVILRIVIMLNDLNPFRFFTMRQNSRKPFFFKCWEWKDPLEFLKCNEWLNTGRPAGGGGGEGMGSGQQVSLLLWKNWTIRRRQRVRFHTESHNSQWAQTSICF